MTGDRARPPAPARPDRAPPDPNAPLPPGWGLALDPATRRLDDGTALLGGSPLRLLRLGAAGAALVARLAAGNPVPTGDPAAHRLARSLVAAGIAHPRPAGTTLGADVAVVIPTHDRPDGLAATLAGLERWRDAGGPPVEIVVVDDASTDGAATARVAERAGATVIRHAVNRGPAAARNSGWPATTAPLVAFVDADCEPRPGWLDPLIAQLADPLVALAAPRITPGADAKAPRWLTDYEANRSPLDLGPAEAPVLPRSRVPYVPSTAIVVRRKALEAVGGFDEAMRVGEDVDLVWRLAAAGWHVRYDPSATVAHPVRPSGRAWLAQRVAYGSSAAALADRHGPAVAPLVVSRWSLAAWSLVGLGFGRAGVAIGVGTTVALGVQVRGRGRRPRVAHPWREAGRVAGLGNLFAGRGIAEAVRRAWWPVAVPLAAFAGGRMRRAIVVAMIVPPLVDWVRARPPGLGPLRWTALRLADDTAYGAGLWLGALRVRSLAALRPDLG